MTRSDAPAFFRLSQYQYPAKRKLARKRMHSPVASRPFELLERRLLLSTGFMNGTAGCGCAVCQAAARSLSDSTQSQPNELVVNHLARSTESADRMWQPLASMPAARGRVSYLGDLRAYTPFSINLTQLNSTLARAPKEFTAAARTSPLVLSLPTPTGGMQRFNVVETQVLAPQLAAQFPQIKTYVAKGIDDPYATARLDINPHTGFHAMVLSPSGTWAIDNYFHNDKSTFVSYFKSDINRVNDFRCLTVSTPNDAPVFPGAGPDGEPENIPAGNVLRTFRLAVTTTTSYNSFHGNTISTVLAAVTTTVNRMTGIYEKDIASRLELVADTTLLFSGLNGNPIIAGGTNVSSLALNNQAFTDGRIGFSSYDVGHVFSSGPNNGISQGGIGIVGSSAKARACSQTSPPSGDLFSVDYVSHEVGHQFNGRHNFSNCGGGPGDSGLIANEPGSGATIMGYAGICGANNLQPNSDAMFNHINYNQMYPYVVNTIPGVGTTTATGNNAPNVNAGPDYVIPSRTPYVLTATGSDPDGNPLTWSWEQKDAAGSVPVNNTGGTTGPVVRTWLPASSPARTIPRPINLVNNNTVIGEVLTTVSRTMNFRVVARDNLGGVNFDDMVITTVNVGATGFQVTSPNTSGITWNVGTSQLVSWNVASTNVSPINTANVNITMSLDGGFTYPITLLSNTPNDGSESITVPGNITTQARVRVEAVGNIFFDISNFNLTIAAVPNTPQQPILSPGTDSGVSNSDRITNFDNSTPPKALIFDVPGTIAGATVTIYADGSPIGSAIASGTTTTVTTNGALALANGLRNITARQTPIGEPESPDSVALGVTIDTIAPGLNGSPNFAFATAPHRLVYNFTEDVGPTLGVGDFGVQQLPSTPVNVSLSYNSGTNAATLTFPDFTNGVLADAQFAATLTAAGVTDLAGNPMAADSNFNFFFLMADFDHNGIVNLLDFNILAANFGQSPRDFTLGDATYDNVVNLNDFNVLAGRFGATVAPDARSSGQSLFGDTRFSDKDWSDELADLLA